MAPHNTQSDVDLDKPLSPAQLVEAEGLSSRRVVYEAIYAGAEYYREGRAVRMTIRQWRNRPRMQLVPAGTYVKDPVRSERALRRAAKRSEAK
jgi:hypothetical protein